MESPISNHLDPATAAKRRDRLVRYVKLSGNPLQPKVAVELEFAMALQISQCSRADHLAEARAFPGHHPRRRMKARPFVSVFVRRHRRLARKLARASGLAALNATWLGMLATLFVLSS